MHRNISDESEIYKVGDSEAITHSTRRKGRADLIVLYLQNLQLGKGEMLLILNEQMDNLRIVI